MERAICFIVLAVITIVWLVSSPSGYNRHDLIKNSDVIAFVNVDNFRCTKNSCHRGSMTVETTNNTADIYPIYSIKGLLPNSTTIRLPVT